MNYLDVINKFKTPTYVYDINILEKRIKYIKSKLKYKIIYAVKANTFVLPFIDNLIDGYEICSPGEFRIMEKLNIDKDKYVISGVYKDEESISYMIKNDIKKFTIESINQYKLLIKLTKKYNKKINVLIRLTSNNQFGVTEDEFKEIIKTKNNCINIVGIEYFSGTQKHSIKKINKEIDYIIGFINEIEKEYNIEINEVEYGTGSPVYYFKDEEFDEEKYFDELNIALSKINKKVSLEIGRSMVASSGFYFTSVVDLKSNKYGNNVILDGGINQLVYYGQTMAMRIPYFDVYPIRNKIEKNYNLYGSLCTVNDIIVKNVSLSELKINDTFIFKNVGAYSSTEGISLFLSRDLPKIVIYDQYGVYHLVRDIIKTSVINFPKKEV